MSALTSQQTAARSKKSQSFSTSKKIVTRARLTDQAKNDGDLVGVIG